ncbi:hypothetical protein, partial [Vibrio paucivorans]
MKKTILIAAMATACGFTTINAHAADEPAQAVLIWNGIVPGAIVGSDIGLASPTGGDIQQGDLSLAENGTFDSTIVNIKAFSLTPEGEIDPETQYPEAIDWSPYNVIVQHNGAEGNAYESTNAKIFLNGTETATGESVQTEAGSPNMSVYVAYAAQPTGLVNVNDSVSVTATLFAEGSAGSGSGGEGAL